MVLSIPNWTSPAGQLHCALRAKFKRELAYSPFSREWPTQEEMQLRYQALAAFFGVEMTLEMSMPEELIGNQGSYWADEVNGTPYRIRGISHFHWGSDGLWVVKFEHHILAFKIVGYPVGGETLSFHRVNGIWEFGGYGQMSIKTFFDCLFCYAGWGNNTAAHKVAQTLGGVLDNNLRYDDLLPRIGLQHLDEELYSRVFGSNN